MTVLRTMFALVLIAFAGPACATPPEPFTSFKDCDDCPQMIVVPPGRFIMGDDERHKTEMPAHYVDIDYSFALGKYEVTFDEWQACFDAKGCSVMPGDHNWGTGRRPIINITWADAQEYVIWLTAKSGKVYRLPSEAEWEYAARAGTTTNYFWGDTLIKKIANCRDCGPKISHQSEPVGSFVANPWGFFDTHGNLWEWALDCWNPTHDGAPADGAAREDGDCQQRVIRSGSWYYFSKNLRSSWRFKNDSRVKSYGIGIRVLKELN